MFAQCPLEIKALDEAGKFEGYGAVFGNRDLDGDIIEPGAFVQVQTTKDGKLRIAYMHDLGKIIAKADYRQDSKGLFISGQLNMGVSYAKDAYELMRDGSMDGFSVGFDVLPGGQEYKTEPDGTTTRHITKARLWETSLVTYGANPEALMTEIKDFSQSQDLREFEGWLRDMHGYSRRDAVAKASRLNKLLRRDAAAARDDSGEIDSETLLALKTAINKFSIQGT